jgi:hypothetical protein
MRIRHLAYTVVLTLLLAVGGLAQTASVSPTSLAFGNQPAAVASAPRTITLTNSSGTALTVSDIHFVGPHYSDFFQSNNCTSVAAGGSCTINVEIVPASAGVRTATLQITDNAPGSPQRVPVSGTGLHDIILTWTASVSSGVIGYYVYRGTAAGGESSTPLNATPVNAVFYVDATVKQGIVYYYVVRSSTGVALSGNSNEAHAKIKSPSGIVN